MDGTSEWSRKCARQIVMQFEIQPSRTFVALLLAVHLLAMITISLTDLPVWARISIVLLIAASLIHHLRSKQSWRSFTLDQRRVTVTTLGGSVLSGELAQQSVVIPYCVVLCARLDGARFIVCQVIFPDAMQKEAFRELRVRLRFS